MKILYHHRTLSKDGQDVHIGEMIAALRRRGHQVIVVAPPTTEDAPFGSDGGLLSLIRAKLPHAVAEILELAYSIPAYRRLLQAWKREQPDVLYERYNLYFLAGRWLRARTGIPFLVEVNAPLCDERRQHGGLALPALARWSERTVWRAADYVLPVTRVLAGHLTAAGIPEQRIRVIANGVNRDRFPATTDGAAARAELKLEGRVVLGFTGFMRSWHGLTHVLDAMAEMPDRSDLHFLVIGDGPAREEIEARARALSMEDRVTILGIVPRDKVSHYTAAFDIALQPRVVDYASPLKLFEYMALGRAIIAPDQPNIREVLTDQRDALLVPEGDDTAFRAAVIRLCSDPDLRNRLGRGASERIEAGEFTWDRNAARIEALAEDASHAASWAPQASNSKP